jgi:hypothetical protein
VHGRVERYCAEMQSQSGNAESIRQDLIATVPRITDDVCPSDQLDWFIRRAEPAFAQACNPALAAGFLYQCTSAADALYFDRRGFRHSREDSGFHDNHGFHGDGGKNNSRRGVGHGGAMEHGEGAGRGR